MRGDTRTHLAAAVAIAMTIARATGAPARAEPAASAAKLARYESKYYTIYTDLDADVVREASARMTHMVDEYLERTRSFTGQLRRRFPFYMFRSADDYFAAGGIKGSAGVFMSDGAGGGKLMAVAGGRINAYTWHTVQHEGFHQFVHAVIGGDIPTWMNEGMAEYFGESLYTGDGFVTGVVPPWRLSRLKTEIGRGQLKSIRELMAIDGRTWNAEMNILNYDQAWSMVHFLVHADDGRYAPRFSLCIREISQGRSAEAAWRDAIGTTEGFEERWKAYWLAQPPSPTHDLYRRATVATLTSFLARATAARQAFPNLASFTAAAEGGTLKISPDEWLPPSLLSGTLRSVQLSTAAAAPAGNAPGNAPKPDAWELRPGPSKLPNLTLTTPEGVRMTGWFTLSGSRVGAVNMEVDDTATVLADATVLRDAGKKSQARTRLLAALQAHPKSPLANDVRAFLKTLR